jgi:hypothetical protein
MKKEMGEAATPAMGSIERMEIRPAENGGHVVTHHMKAKMARDSKSHSGMAMGYSEPETHVFGKDEGHEMLAHVANHLHIKEMAKEESGGAGEQETEEGDE